MTAQPTKTKPDVPYISMRALIIMHVLLGLFIALVYWKLSVQTDF